MIRAFIISGIRLYREGLAEVLARSERLRVVGTAASVGAAIEDPAAPEAEAFLVDMGSAEALDAVAAIDVRFRSAKVVALGVANVESEVIACAEAGYAGYVLREDSVEDLVQAVESAAQEKLRCSGTIAAALQRRVAKLAARTAALRRQIPLTRREQEVVGLIDRGLTNKEIASRLVISVATVKNHVHNILEKLDVHTRGQAAARVRGLMAGRGRPLQTPAAIDPERRLSL